MFDEGTSYIFNPSVESIPEGSVYIVIQSQAADNKVYYVSEENLGTGIDIRKAILDKNHISDLNSDISNLKFYAVKKYHSINLFNNISPYLCSSILLYMFS